MERHLKETRLLNFNHSSLTELVKNRGWTSLSEYERIARTYDFVQAAAGLVLVKMLYIEDTLNDPLEPDDAKGVFATLGALLSCSERHPAIALQRQLHTAPKISQPSCCFRLHKKSIESFNNRSSWTRCSGISFLIWFLIGVCALAYRAF